MLPPLTCSYRARSFLPHYERKMGPAPSIAPLRHGSNRSEGSSITVPRLYIDGDVELRYQEKERSRPITDLEPH